MHGKLLCSEEEEKKTNIFPKIIYNPQNEPPSISLLRAFQLQNYDDFLTDRQRSISNGKKERKREREKFVFEKQLPLMDGGLTVRPKIKATGNPKSKNNT